MMDANFIYLATLATIQPARVQDVEKFAPQLFRAFFSNGLQSSIREVHQSCIDAGLIIAVRKGVYVVSKNANNLLRTGNFGKGLDNRRLFLLKQTRRGIK